MNNMHSILGLGPETMKKKKSWRIFFCLYSLIFFYDQAPVYMYIHGVMAYTCIIIFISNEGEKEKRTIE